MPVLAGRTGQSPRPKRFVRAREPMARLGNGTNVRDGAYAPVPPESWGCPNDLPSESPSAATALKNLGELGALA
jgi:hypothetical protein